MTPDKSEWVICSCHSHAVKVETMIEDFTNEVFLSLWTHGFDLDNRPSFWHRLKQAWRVLRYFDHSNNEIILHKDEALKLGNTLIEMAGTCVKKDCEV